jgi:putative GTP pyrophosphokinase
MMKPDDLVSRYSERFHDYLVPMSKAVEAFLYDTVKTYPRIDMVTARAKGIESFMEKASKGENGRPKYTDPLAQIQDQIGARVVTRYLCDVDAISQLVEHYFSTIEAQRVVPDSPKEFGYEGKHYILLIPDDLFVGSLKGMRQPQVFELQVKTIFQYAWGEADHDLGYKPSGQLSNDQKRRIAFTAAQAWGADRIFDELSRDLVQFN